MAITRAYASGHGGRPAGPFSGKTAGPSGGAHPVADLTRSGGAHGIRRAGSFAGKASGPSGGGHPVGVLSRSCGAGYGMRRAGSFADKATGIVVPPYAQPSAGGPIHWPRRKKQRQVEELEALLIAGLL